MNLGSALLGPTAQRAEIVAFARDPESCAFLNEYLRDVASGGQVVVGKGGVDDAIHTLENMESPPRVLIVDLSGVETPLFEVDRLAEVCEPNIVVVAIGETENVHLFRELIRAGVADYITKPLVPDLLNPYVRDRRERIGSSDAPARRGKLVVVAGARGGVGASTLAVSTAWSLAHEQKRRVALVDLDLHGGSACVQLGLEPGGLSEALSNHERLDPLFLERTVIRESARLSVMAEEVDIVRDVVLDPVAVDGVIGALAEEFHYVIVDLPAHFGAVHAHLLDVARTRIIVADRTLPAMRDAARMLAVASAKPEPIFLILNDHHPGLSRAIPSETIAQALGRTPDLEIAYDKTAAASAENMGEPLGAGKGLFAQGSRALVGRLTGRRKAARGGFFARLRGRS